MYTAVQNPDGKTWKSDGQSLSDQTISNMIGILTNSELSKLFTDDELLMIKMSVKTNIAEKAEGTIKMVSEDFADRVMAEDYEGKKFR